MKAVIFHLFIRHTIERRSLGLEKTELTNFFLPFFTSRNCATGQFSSATHQRSSTLYPANSVSQGILIKSVHGVTCGDDTWAVKTKDKFIANPKEKNCKNHVSGEKIIRFRRGNYYQAGRIVQVKII